MPDRGTDLSPFMEAITEEMERAAGGAEAIGDAFIRLHDSTRRATTAIVGSTIDILNPEWSMRKWEDPTGTDLGYIVGMRIGSFTWSQQWTGEAMSDLLNGDYPWIWEHIEQAGLAAYVDWILDETQHVILQPMDSIRVSDSEWSYEMSAQEWNAMTVRISEAVGINVHPRPWHPTSPEDIPGVTWRDKERWIRELETTPYEPDESGGGMSSEELLDAIGSALDEKEEA